MWHATHAGRGPTRSPADADASEHRRDERQERHRGTQFTSGPIFETPDQQAAEPPQRSRGRQELAKPQQPKSRCHLVQLKQQAMLVHAADSFDWFDLASVARRPTTFRR
jgi:hypothetical protein